MRLTTEEREGHRIVHIEGEFDTFAARSIREKLSLLRSPDRFVVDLGGVSFIDSAGLHALFGIGRLAKDVGARVVFVVPGESPVRRVIDLVQLADVSPVCESAEHALERLRHAEPERHAADAG